MSVVAFLPVIGQIIDRIWPDKTEAERAKAELALLESSGELQNMLAQLEVNAEEAKSDSLFIAGWRPFIGWVCGLSFAYHFLVVPTVIFVSGLYGIDIPLPEFDMNSLLTVLLGMLGLGGLRSFEKYKGIARNKM